MLFIDEKVEDVGPLEADKSDIREDPYTLPDKFKWDCLDLDDDKQVIARVDDVYRDLERRVSYFSLPCSVKL